MVEVESTELNIKPKISYINRNALLNATLVAKNVINKQHFNVFAHDAEMCSYCSFHL